MGLTKPLIACCLTFIVLFTASPLKAIDQDLSYEGCDIELDWQPTWRDCPRSFDAGTPQQIRKKINDAGLSCIKPKSVGSDRNGGKFLQCLIGSQPITILSWPSNAGLVQYVYKSSSLGRDFFTPQVRKSQWAGCAAVLLETPRYIIWIPAQDPNLKPTGDLVSGLRKALGIPKFFKRDKAGRIWSVGAVESNFKGAIEACGG